MFLKYIVSTENNLKEILKQNFGISERLLLKLKKYKKIYINKTNNIYIDYPIKQNDEIYIDLNFEEDNSNIFPVKMDLDILYEDEALIIVNKPPFMPVHPSINHYEDSISNGIKYYFDKINLKRKIRPINRLDKNTSGIVIFAKNEYIQDRFNNYKKEYLAIVEGTLIGNGFINKPIARKEDSIIERCIKENGDNALTEYISLNNFNINGINLSLIKCILHTGRTHQIRVHLAHIGHPILGDSLYGNESYLINRQALHAYKISFVHPITKKQIDITCDLPNDIQKLSVVF